MLGSCSTTFVGSTRASFGDEREPAVPERERVSRMEPAVLELVHRAQRERAEVVELPDAAEVEERVAVDDALDPPEERAEHDSREHDRASSGQGLVAAPPPPRERKRHHARGEDEREREAERCVHRERERERPRDERARPGEGGSGAPPAERARDEAAGEQEHERRGREAKPQSDPLPRQEPREEQKQNGEPGGHSARTTSNRRRSNRPRRRIARAARAYAAPRCFVRKRSWLLTFSASIRPPCEPP